MRPKEFTARSRSRSTRKSPPRAAEISILPSLGFEALIPSFMHMSRRISAASSSWYGLPSFSQTYMLSLPTLSSTGMSSGWMMCPLRKTTSLVTPLMICVISWQRVIPTASSVLTSFI